MLKIIPSILTSSTQELNSLLKQIENVAERVHIDIIDGIFSQEETITPKDVSETSFLTDFDYHLMVDKPLSWINQIEHGSSVRVIGQIEKMVNQRFFCETVKSHGSLAGLALDLNTPIDNLESDALSLCSVILVMSVKAGLGGQEFDDMAIDKIEELSKLREHAFFPYVIVDDGGITFENIDDVRLAGVDEVVIGRRLFEGDLGQNIKKYTLTAYGKR